MGLIKELATNISAMPTYFRAYESIQYWPGDKSMGQKHATRSDMIAMKFETLGMCHFVIFRNITWENFRTKIHF